MTVLIAGGIVLMPDSFFDWAESRVQGVADYISGEAQKRAPEIKEDVIVQVKETGDDAKNVYESAKGYFPKIGDRIWQFILYWR